VNKQQLAAKIWESANQMRSKIEANEYKDYILGFIFYKYLSDKLEQYAKEQDFSAEDIRALSEDDTETVEFIKSGLGYFIAHQHLFSTWIAQGSDFGVAEVRDALSAFSRLIHPNHKLLFDGIFKTLETGLSKLGDTAAKQTKAISELIQLIKDIPMDGRQGYDVLGFIYEYLIGMFAANAGKKAGEFYTPHEVSVLMSEIIAAHVKGKEKIDIYDSTSGSGSLLLNIGKAIAKHMGNQGTIKYYAQELKENTYNLTRMNLVMRGILPTNICTRNGDTLEDDWPFFDDNDPVNSYNPLYLDAVVSNPPYSQQWEPEHKDSDPRYARFGLAPKSKADYAFLLHDLYHLKPDGVMAIVLPHGVLFRGGEEGQIRKNLIENDHLDTIIGLPANIFFGTGIPTIILVLKQKRQNSDVLIVDASKGFAKEGKNNKLRACDIKKISDTVIGRLNLPRYSRVVAKDEIRANGYNLNIPRYVDSSEAAESWDLYASMFGGIPHSELAALDAYWQALPGLRDALFSDEPYATLKVDDLAQAIRDHAEVQSFTANFAAAFADFPDYLKVELIARMATLNVPRQESLIGEAIFRRLQALPLIDQYQAYQMLDDHWQAIAVDLEILQTEGFDAARVVEPNLVIKKKKGKEVEEQEGWKGRVLPFELVQATLKQDSDALHLLTKTTIEGLSDAQVHALLQGKWITPLNDALHRLPEQQIDSLTSKLQALVDKYQITYADTAREIQHTEGELAAMLDELDGSEFDLQGLAELKNLLAGD
jgi:type I restriction enzyme M protein